MSGTKEVKIHSKQDGSQTASTGQRAAGRGRGWWKEDRRSGGEGEREGKDETGVHSGWE